MFKEKKKAGRSFILASVGMGVALTMGGVAPFAHAEGGGNDGGGEATHGCINDSCTLTGPLYWRYASSGSSGKSAWDKFAANDTSAGAGMREDTVSSHILNDIKPIGALSNQEVLDSCKTSQMIWWVSGNGNVIPGFGDAWAWNAMTGNEGTYPNAGANTFTTALPFSGSSMDSNLQKRMEEFVEKSGSNRPNILCSNMAGPPKPSDSVQQWTETRDVAPKVETQQWTRPYSYSTQITRQITDSNGNDPIGKNNLHDQPVSATKTTFGALWDDMQKNPDKYKTMSSSQVEALVNEAKKADDKASHNNTNLDAQNKEGMSEGGVLNVNQLTKNATIKTTKTTQITSVRTCTRNTGWTLDNSSNQWQPSTPETSCGPWSDTEQSPTFTNDTVIDSTLQQTGFWQMLSVHCNKAQLEALLANIQGARVVNTGDATHKYSAVVYSKVYQSQPDTLDFGDANNPNKALAASANLGFYDKKCPFSCTVSSMGSGASGDNGAKTNIGSTIPKGGNSKGAYGAISGNSNGNSFEFFRDNSNHVISVDVWYPKIESVVNYSGQAPLFTTVNRWKDGTPGVSDSSGGGKFSMSALDGTPLFQGSDASPSDKSWATETYSNSTATMLKGLQRSFNVKSTWASDSGKPQVLNFRWDYAPQVSTKFITDGVGFDSNNQIAGKETKNSTAIEGECFAAFGTKTSIDTSNTLQNATGSGSTNTIDNSITSADKNNKQNLFINFLRATTE